jgi:hypothetical protein
MTKTERAAVYAADAAADAADAAYEAVVADARTRFGQVYRGGVNIFTRETLTEQLALAKAKHAVKAVNALLNGKECPKWRFDHKIEQAVIEVEQKKAADMSAYFADHPQATVEDFRAAVEDDVQAKLNADALEQAKRSAKLWDEREASRAAGLPWSPPDGHDDIKWIAALRQ